MLHDLRYALRVLGKNPGFAAAAILTLALGIGANSAIFTVVDAVISRPLPFAEPNSLIDIYRMHPTGRFFMPRLPHTMIAEWREQADIFTAVEPHDGRSYVSTTGETPQRLNGRRISAGMIPMLGVPPAVGRTFTAEEVTADAKLVVLSYGLWQRLYGGSRDVLGSKLNLDNHDYEVIGVMPESFMFPYATISLWTPLYTPPGRVPQTDVLARLRPGISLAAAQERADAVSEALNAEKPVEDGWKIRLRDLNARRVNAEPRKALLLMLGAVGFVLLIACANAANLMLTRAASRQRELAVRAALGAGRWPLVRQFLSESLLLAVAGGGVGVLLAMWLTEIVVAIAPRGLTFLSLNEIRVDLRVLAFTFGISLLTGLIFGLAPALRATRINLNDALKSASRASTGSGRHNLFRNTLVVVQMALSMVLLVGAGLLVHSFLRLQAIEPGFDTRNVVTIDLSLPSWKYSSPAARNQFYEELTERMRALPAVADATVSGGAPPAGGGLMFGLDVETEGSPVPTDPNLVLPMNTVTADYFRVLRIPLKRGRYLTEADANPSAPGIIINEGMARRLWPVTEAVGGRLRLTTRGSWYNVVGVVGDTYQFRPSNLPGSFEVYMTGAEGVMGWAQQTLIVRTTATPETMFAALRDAVWSVDPGQPITKMTTIEEEYSSQFFGEQRFYLALMTAFAGVAALLAAVGIYGVVSYSVAQRTQEFGIRLALGAGPGNVLRLVLRRSVVLIALGMASGAAAALGLSRYLTALLVDVHPADGLTYAAVAAVLSVVALAACWIPARRATRVDPMVALRDE